MQKKNFIASQLAVIIGVRQTRIKVDCFIRLHWVLSHLKMRGVQHIFIGDTSTKYGALLISKVCQRFQATHIKVPMGLHTPGRVRNAAWNYIEKNSELKKISHMLFLDVDVLGQSGSWERIEADIAARTAFAWYPVIFTTHGNKLMRKYIKKEGMYNLTSMPRIQTGYATGIQLVSRDFMADLNGYDNRFYGYGCEDIEMIHRATLYSGQRPAFPPAHEYFEDYRTSIAANYKGYRLWMRNQHLDFPEAEMFVHFAHKRHEVSSYMQARKKNDALLAVLMVDIDKG